MADTQPHLIPANDTGPIELDGRRQRRDRNRNAVVDAMLDLHSEGNLGPSVAEIADRSGVSHRSVFRYFDDLDDLVAVACARSAVRFADVYVIANFGEGTLTERIDRLVTQRIALFEKAGPTGRAGRLKAPFMEVLQDDLKRTRALQREQIRVQFAPELSRLAEPLDAAMLSTLDVLLSLESHDLLRYDQGLSKAKTAGVLRSSLHQLLS